jgi:two-component system, OmpR family, KDP operon response regulator KdpE
MPSILVVDDDPQVLRVLRIALTGHGYSVLTAHDGDAALRTVSHWQPESIVVDLGLPDVEGVELIARIRRRVAVPILVFTARRSVAERDRALAAGAGAVLTKPAPVSDLVARLRALVSGRTAER